MLILKIQYILYKSLFITKLEIYIHRVGEREVHENNNNDNNITNKKVINKRI